MTNKSDEGASGEIVHYGADDRVGRDSFQQRRAAGDDRYSNDQDGADDGDDLLDALFAGADPGDMLADTRATAGAYAAALDDQVTPALGTFDFSSQRHCGVGMAVALKRYEVRGSLARPSHVHVVTPNRDRLSSAGNSNLRVHFPLGMNPGMPVSTTELSLTRVLIP